MVKGSERRFWYSSTLMSLVRVKAFSDRASGGKFGTVKDWSGIWAPWACPGSTGSPGGREGLVVAIVGEVCSRRMEEVDEDEFAVSNQIRAEG